MPPGTVAAEGGKGRGETLLAGEAALLVTIVRSGVPVSGVRIDVRDGAKAATRITGGDGRGEFANLPAGSYEVRARMPPPSSLALQSSLPLALSEGESVEISYDVPEEAEEITGRVLDSDGQPLSGIEVEARPITFPGSVAFFVTDGSRGPALTGPDGSFRFEGVPLLEHLLSTRETPRYSSVQTTVPAVRSEPVEIILGVRKTLVIHGTVRDGSGSPVAKALVSSPIHSGQPAEAGSDGEYLLDLAYQGGAVGLSASKEGYAHAAKLLLEGEVEGREELEVDLVLERMGTVGEVTGRVVSAADGSPVPGQVVLLHSARLNATYQVRSGEDGSYALSEVRPAGDYRIWVNPDRSFRDYNLFPQSVEAETLRLEIVLEPLGTSRIRGRMIDPEGAPLPWLTLWIRSQAASGNSVRLAGDAEGRFGFQEVPAGDLVIESRAAPWISVRGMRVEADEDREVEITVGLGRGSLTGFVTDALSRPVSRARLNLTWSKRRGPPQSTVYRETVSDAEGRFRFSGLARGQAVLRAAARSFSELSIRRDLSGGDEEVRIGLSPASD